METKNTITCTWIGEVNDENIKEMAKVMMWNCGVAQYKDGDIIANAGLHMRDKEPHLLNVNIDGIHYNFPLTSKRVSEKMGNEIIEYILKAVAFYKNRPVYDIYKNRDTQEYKITESGMEKITKKYAEDAAREFWDNYMNNNYEALCFEVDGLHWQIRLDEDDDETFIIGVEGYSEERCDWVCRDDVADIIYEFVNR